MFYFKGQAWHLIELVDPMDLMCHLLSICDLQIQLVVWSIILLDEYINKMWNTRDDMVFTDQIILYRKNQNSWLSLLPRPCLSEIKKCRDPLQIIVEHNWIFLILWITRPTSYVWYIRPFTFFLQLLKNL